jgi:hypothetical protein
MHFSTPPWVLSLLARRLFCRGGYRCGQAEHNGS